jgi:predicted metalloprotease with PDZ domain
MESTGFSFDWQSGLISVEGGSLAEYCGLRSGDKLVSVNRLHLKTSASNDRIQALLTRPSGVLCLRVQPVKALTPTQQAKLRVRYSIIVSQCFF